MTPYSIDVLGLSISIHIFDIITIVIGLLVSIVLGIKAKQTGSHQLRNYIPTAWTSLGIFFTFVSIWWSLGGSKDKDFDPKMMQNLIYNIVPAFSTSIIGILGAFVSSICNKWIIAKEEQQENLKFLNLKKQKVGQDCNSDSPELILLEIISSIRENTNSTCSALSDSDRKTRGLKNEILDSGFGSTNKVIKESIETQQRSYISALTELKQLFEESMNTQQNTFTSQLGELRIMLRDEVQNIANTNQTLLTKLLDQEKQLLELTTTKLFDESKQRNESLKEFITNGSERIENYFESATAKIVELYNRISEDISHHIDAETKLFEHEIKESIESFAHAQYEKCSTTIESFNTKLLNYSQTAIDTQKSITDNYIKTLEEKLLATSEEFIKSVGKISGVLADKLEGIHKSEVEKIGLALTDNRESLKILLDENKIAIRNVALDISSKYVAFKEEVIASQEKLRDNLTEVQKQHSNETVKIQQEISGKLSETALQISKIATELHNSLTSIKETITKSVDEFAKQQETLKYNIVTKNMALSADIAEKIHSSARIKELEEASNRLTSEIDNCMLNIHNKMQIIVKQLELTGSLIDESSRSYKESVNQSAVLNQYIEGTVDLFKQHMTSLNMMKSSMDRMEQSIGRMTERVETAVIQFVKSPERKQSQKTKEQQ